MATSILRSIKISCLNESKIDIFFPLAPFNIDSLYLKLYFH